MSCEQGAPGDYELADVIDAAQAFGMGVMEDDGGIIIEGPNVGCNASRLEEGSDRVEVWRIESDDPSECQAFLDRLTSLSNGDTV